MNRVRHRRQQRERAGRRAEYIAALWLMLKGYRLLAMRYRTPQGEIDLIMRRRGVVAFVEVKARAQVRDAAEAVHRRNQQRVVRAAQWWLGQHAWAAHATVRFDVCLLAWYRLPHHIPHAFTA